MYLRFDISVVQHYKVVIVPSYMKTFRTARHLLNYTNIYVVFLINTKIWFWKLNVQYILKYNIFFKFHGPFGDWNRWNVLWESILCNLSHFLRDLKVMYPSGSLPVKVYICFIHSQLCSIVYMYKINLLCTYTSYKAIPFHFTL